MVQVLARQTGESQFSSLSPTSRARRRRPRALADLCGRGLGALIADAVFKRGLEAIGAVALDHRVSVGASGLRLGLAHALITWRPGKPGAPDHCPLAGRRGEHALAGGCSRRRSSRSPTPKLSCRCCHDPDQAVAGAGEARRALAWAREHFEESPS